MPQESCAVILAAGEGKRMKSRRPKALSPVLFKPMLQWVLDSVRAAGIRRVCVVTGYRHEEVERYLAEHAPEVSTVYQAERMGTGHAVMTAEGFLRACGGDVLVLNGDAPFLDAETIRGAHRAHTEQGCSVTVVSAELDDPSGYGRIVRDAETHRVCGIVEQKDASGPVRAVREVNSGAYWFRAEDLLGILSKIGNDNNQKEYYLTDAVRLLIAAGKRADAFAAGSADTVLGANDCLQLAALDAAAREKILRGLMAGGTDIPCGDGVIVGPDVTVGRGVCILPGTILKGRTSVGPDCTVGPNTLLEDCAVGAGSVLNSVQGRGKTIAPGTAAVPFTVL